LGAMPLFRRTPRAPQPTLQFTVGVHDDRVVVGDGDAGIVQLDELRDYVGSVVVLAYEELVAQGVVPGDEVPAEPELPPVPRQSSTYDFIQATHARAEARMAYLEACDAVLGRHGVAILPPLPPEGDPALRSYRP